MKTNQQLINNIIGQLNGISRMIDDDKDCFKVLVQIKAAKSALDSFTQKYIEENFTSCLKTCATNKEKNQVCQQFFKEIVKN